MPGSPACERVADPAGRDRARRRAAPARPLRRRCRASAPSSRSTSTLPPRPWPKVKSSPVTTPAAPMLPGEQLARRNPRRWSRRGRRRSRTPASRRRRRGRTVLALVEAGQAERRHVGLEEAHRVRVEGGDDHRAPLVVAAGDGAADHRLVAEVEAVEIAERDDCSAQARRGSAGRGSGAALRRRAVSAASPLGNCMAAPTA